MIRLAVKNGRGAGQTFEPEGELVRLGRSPVNEVVLEDGHVSSEHARIVTYGDRVVLEDLRSTNGTHVVRGGERLSLADLPDRRCALEMDDRIELGSGDERTEIAVTLLD